MHIDPVFIPYSFKCTAEGRVELPRIGAAYPHATSNGLTIILDGDSRIVLLKLNDDDRARLKRETKRKRGRQMLSSPPDR